MAKLTRSEIRDHKLAMGILTKPVLDHDDKETVFRCFHEGANSMNSESGAFFTPLELAYDTALECGYGPGKGERIIDLCAGIGVLAHATLTRKPDARVVCVERNPDYVAVGKKLVPNAEWICADVTDARAMAELGQFSTAISNPPFGRVRSFKDTKSPRYKGGEAEFKVIDTASTMAAYGVFILPQQSAGFEYSGAQCFRANPSSKYRKFRDDTNIDLDAGLGIDTTHCHYDGWKGVSCRVEIACAEFGHIGRENTQSDLFGAAA